MHHSLQRCVSSGNDWESDAVATSGSQEAVALQRQPWSGHASASHGSWTKPNMGPPCKDINAWPVDSLNILRD